MLGKALLNVAEFVHETAPVERVLVLGKEKVKDDEAPTLTVRVDAQILKIGHNKVVNSTSGNFTLEPDRYETTVIN